MIRAYHFTGPKLRDGRPVPAIGEWLVYEGDLEICRSGLHASRASLDALRYAPGSLLHLVDCEGDVCEQPDKLICRCRRIVATVDASRIMRQFTSECAALACWCAGLTDDVYQRAALGTTSFAAGDITEQQMLDLWAAAWDAAGAAARAAAANRWRELVRAEFAKQGVEVE